MMKTTEEKEKDIRACMATNEECKTNIVCMIAQCISSNKGGKDERLLDIAIAMRMVESIRLTDLAKYVATFEDDVDGDFVFNVWWKSTELFKDKEDDTDSH